MGSRDVGDVTHRNRGLRFETKRSWVPASERESRVSELGDARRLCALRAPRVCWVESWRYKSSRHRKIVSLCPHVEKPLNSKRWISFVPEPISCFRIPIYVYEHFRNIMSLSHIRIMGMLHTHTHTYIYIYIMRVFIDDNSQANTRLRVCCQRGLEYTDCFTIREVRSLLKQCLISGIKFHPVRLQIWTSEVSSIFPLPLLLGLLWAVVLVPVSLILVRYVSKLFVFERNVNFKH